MLTLEYSVNFANEYSLFFCSVPIFNYQCGLKSHFIACNFVFDFYIAECFIAVW